MFRTLLVLATVVFFVREAKAQTVDSLRPYRHNSHHREITLLIGYDQGRYGNAEVGLAANIFGTAHHPYAMAAFIGGEVRVDRTTLIGPKVGIWLAGGVAMGAQAIYYTDGHERSFVLRPEYGFGFHKFKVTYGYNFRITNKDLQGINSHLLNLTYCFRLARLKGDDDRKQ
ncbi:MAG: hypothetical protein KA941_04365 [Flavobacteriales bacterium]|nr:hypothetical protein [Flavobacteriales bacterium]